MVHTSKITSLLYIVINMNKYVPFTNYTEEAFYVGWLYGKLPCEKREAFMGWVKATSPSYDDLQNWLFTNAEADLALSAEQKGVWHLMRQIDVDMCIKAAEAEYIRDERKSVILLAGLAILMMLLVGWAGWKTATIGE